MVFLSVAGRGPSLLLLKQPGEIQGVIVAYGSGDIADGKVRFLQKAAGPADPVVQKILLGRRTGDIFEKPVKISSFNTQIIGDHLDIYGVGVVVFNIPEGFFHIGDLFSLAVTYFLGNLLARR